jgi:hypothetical protein
MGVPSWEMNERIKELEVIQGVGVTLVQLV